MAGRKKKSKEVGVEELRALAKTYGLEENPLLISQIEMYAVQQRVISMIREELNSSDAAVSKEYVKGRENLYAHPLIKELPKHADSATRTADGIVKLIKELGTKGGDDDGFEAFVSSR